MKILITGANGMLGSSLCRLYNEHHDVHALHRDQECFSACSADHSLDLTQSKKVQELFSQIKPDLVIHGAGLASIDRCEREPIVARVANVAATESAAKSCPVESKLVYISTDQVYGASADHSEANKHPQPVNEYGKTKLAGEEKVQQYSSNHIIVRTNIFGWNVKPGRVSSAEWIYQSLTDGKPITLFTDYTFSPIYAEYLGEIILQLAKRNFSGVINVGSPSPCSKYEFGIGLADTFKLDSAMIRADSITQADFLAPRCKKLDLDTSKLMKLGITPPDHGCSLEQFKKRIKLPSQPAS